MFSYNPHIAKPAKRAIDPKRQAAVAKAFEAIEMAIVLHGEGSDEHIAAREKLQRAMMRAIR
jgi:isopentenyl phosphate kinase